MATGKQNQRDELRKLNGHCGVAAELAELMEDLGFEVWQCTGSDDWRIVEIGDFVPDGAKTVGHIVFDGRRHRIQL